MATPAPSYRRNPNLKTRPMDGSNGLLVFTSDSPNIYALNPTAWLILELCDQLPMDEIIEQYLEAAPPNVSREEAIEKLRRGIALLEQRGLIERLD
jgi:hypothetical protein